VQTPRTFTTGRVVTALAVTGAMVTGSLAALPANAATDSTTVTYRGVTVTVPASWPVIRLDGKSGCVRFDRHAVYLGDPASSNCPAHVLGHVESVHLTDGVVSDARSPEAAIGGGRQITGGSAIHPDLVVTDDTSPVRVVVTAGQTESIAKGIAASVSFKPAGSRVQSFSTKSSTTSAADSSGKVAAPAAAAAAPSTYTGLGFDACLTPSTSTMANWRASPYRAVNMYVGGASRGCPNQPNLTSSWVNTVVAAGWTLIPTYVGLQATCTNYSHRITKGQEAAQGSASADDAVAILKSLGLGAGSIVYFDIEAYDYTKPKCVAKAQKFLDAWTVRLHALNYLSGIYSSSNTMNATLVDRLGDSTFHQPDDIWFARWNNDDSVFGDVSIPNTSWVNHQRIHQYRGGHNETWGGSTINIDSDSVDGDTSPGAPLAEGTFVRESGSSATFRIAGGAPIYVSTWSVFGGVQPVVTVSKTRFRLLPTFPRTGTFLQAAGGSTVYRMHSGMALYVPSWDAFGGPQPTTAVDPAVLAKAGYGGVYNHLISSRPAITMTGSGTLVTTRSSGTATWTSPVLSSAVRYYDARYRLASWNGSFSSWVMPSTWQHTKPKGRTVHVKRGQDFCVSARARNWAGQVTDWGSKRCITRPLDDRSLSASSGWKRGTGAKSDFTAGTFTRTKQHGAKLRVSSAQVRRVGIVATTCASCGEVAVFVGGTRVGIINLASASTEHKVLLMLPRFSRRTADVVVKVRSSGLKVRIDGLAVSRT
jgi:Domain of unknown function (DUF1906)